MNKIVYFISAILFSSLIFAQKDGFWDKERATSKEIVLTAGKRALIKTEELPSGTTEFVFRITLLNEGQKLTSSLVSVLKAIPDPTGISQGAAGAIHLTSAISGDDKCTYAIFNESNQANQFLKDGSSDKACFEQKEKVNKEVKLISTSSTCLTNIPNLWFGFESQNWLLNQKIVLEVVPWVDYNVSRGWTKQTKKEIEKMCTSFSFYHQLSKKEIFTGEFINLFTERYKYAEFKNMLDSEKATINSEITLQSLNNTKQMNDFIELKRKTAWDFYKKGEYQKAISFIQDEIIDNKWAQAKDYSALGDIYIETKQFILAKESYFKATELDSNHLWYQLKYANALVFNDELSEAKEIHKKYKSNNIDAKTSWTQQAKLDIVFYKSKGLNVDDFKKILRILE
ncbi:tetratricopeptide repeat protein [Flavobacterium sp.]|jgi:tetratricopeptide (TPR) repeat protein|uniref:tetratricopeptide repeat protein n=1 Tax=Flavobacterium sp. TaxID=239 RepID=UPI0037BF32CE